LGDCLTHDALASLCDGSVDMVLCDPPFGCTRNQWDIPVDMARLFACLDRVCKPEAAVVFFSQGMFTADLMTGPWKRHWRYNMVWRKNKPRGFLNAKRMPLRYHEDLVVFYKRPPSYTPQMRPSDTPIQSFSRKSLSSNYGNGSGRPSTRVGEKTRFPGSVLDFPVVNAEQKPFHPTQKPVELCEFLVRTFTHEGDLVLDPCAGSGTTGEACVRAGRRFIGFEKEAEYHAKAVERLRTAIPTETMGDDGAGRRGTGIESP
jgi:site-specific DNA-methyltransferase (adenine-specific)